VKLFELRQNYADDLSLAVEVLCNYVFDIPEIIARSLPDTLSSNSSIVNHLMLAIADKRLS